MSGAESPLASTPLAGLMLALSAAASSESAAFYEDMRDGFAKEVVAQYATGTVVLLKPSSIQASNADPLNPFDGVTLRTPRNAIVMGYSSDEIDGSQILAGDRRTLIDAADFTVLNCPAGDDQVEIDGVLHTMISVKPIPAAGVAVIYVLQARTAGG